MAYWFIVLRARKREETRMDSQSLHVGEWLIVVTFNEVRNTREGTDLRKR